MDYATCVNGLPKADVIEFDLEGGNKAIVRPSGTEPKIKLYIFAKGEDAAAADALIDASRRTAVSCCPKTSARPWARSRSWSRARLRLRASACAGHRAWVIEGGPCAVVVYGPPFACAPSGSCCFCVVGGLRPAYFARVPCGLRKGAEFIRAFVETKNTAASERCHAFQEKRR